MTRDDLATLVWRTQRQGMNPGWEDGDTDALLDDDVRCPGARAAYNHIADTILAAYVVLPRPIHEGSITRAGGACRHTLHVTHNWRDPCPTEERA